ncbi:conserved protein of unknown function [Georgfuchsia toluolica]|uniref:WbqC family protein n=1 Tax=Georgfuchsia toluolica TaxID=424218 RepID=A0A916J332_9PROT|nr:WbqC family protein [Georgfuchsia toluolica]CAG4882933.1 conserved protein of unknown function [Georgfuchsia toluolica]
MIVALHQPHFLPWLGYLERMVQADLFIVLDHVQFERRNYQNRTRILVNGLGHWLTVPVQQHSQQELILDKRINNPPLEDSRWWGTNHSQTLRHAYRDAPFVEYYLPALKELLESRWDHLVDLNMATLDFLRDALAISTPMVRSSELGVSGSKSELILNLCRAAGADTYLAGMGGSRDYLDRAAFARANIELAWQDFRHPRYAQCGGGEFVAGLSAVDALFNQGPHSRSFLSGKITTDYPLAASQREVAHA